MGRITIVHTADLHLGKSCLGMPPSIGRQRRKDLMQTLARISEVCREKQADLLLITGDLWEEENVTRPLVDFVADQFRRIPTTKVIITPGKSDGTGLVDFYRQYLWSENVHIFHQPQLSSIWVPSLNTRIFGLAWSPEARSLDWSSVLEQSTDSQIIIAAYGDINDLGIPQVVLELDNLVYVALGGAHKQVSWTDKVMDPGCPEPLDFDHQGTFGILMGSIPLEHFEFSSRQYYKLQLDVEHCNSEEDVAQLITENVRPLAPDKNLFHIDLLGQGRWDISKIQGLLTSSFYISLMARAASPYDIEALEAEQSRGVVGKYISAIKEINCDNEISRRALNLGLDALLSGRVAPW